MSSLKMDVILALYGAPEKDQEQSADTHDYLFPMDEVNIFAMSNLYLILKGANIDLKL